MRDLTDAQWAVLQPLLPPRKRIGRPRADDRRTLNAILYVLRTGCAWRDLPEKDGDDSTAHRRLQRWQQEGVLQRIRRTLLGMSERMKRIDWTSGLLDGSIGILSEPFLAKRQHLTPPPSTSAHRLDAIPPPRE
jgi:transposase